MSNLWCPYIFAKVVNKGLDYHYNSLSIMSITKYNEKTINLVTSR